MRRSPNGQHWCNACYTWSRKHPGQDVANRPRRNRGYAARPNRSYAETLAILTDAAQTTSDECILFDGRQERVRVRINDVTSNAARHVWILANGDPGELHVLHECSQGSGDFGCINPRHMYLGAARDNVDDTVDAERQSRGTERHNARLTPDAVRAIRASALSDTELGREHGVNRRTVADVRAGKTWAWVR